MDLNYKYIVCLVLGMMQYVCSLAQSPIAYYPLNGNAGDMSGRNNNGSIHGGVSPAPDRFGNPCSAMQFNGIDGFIEVPSSTSLELPIDRITMTCWLKLHQSPREKDKWLTLICKGDDPKEMPDNPQYRLQIFQSNTQSTISLDSNFTKYDKDFASHPYEFEKWYHVAMVYDGNQVMVYLNGAKIWSYNYNRPMHRNKMPLHIGADIPGRAEYFCGTLDDVKIFNEALSEQAIVKIYREKNEVPLANAFDITNVPANISVDAEAGKKYAVVKYTEPQLSINCGTASMSRIAGLASGAQFPLGITTIVYKATGSTGLTEFCRFIVEVKPNEKLEFRCPNDTTIFVKNEADSGYFFNFNKPDAGPNAEVKQTTGLKNGDFFPIGNNTLSFSAKDNYNHKMECSYNVIVKYNFPPRILCPKDTTITLSGASDSGYVYKYRMPIGRPAFTRAKVSLTSGLKSGSLFPTGINVLKFKAIDKYGASATCSYNVIVKKNIKTSTPEPQKKVEPQADAKLKEQIKAKTGGTLNVVETHQINTCQVTAVMYDNENEDGDSISLFLNDSEAVHHEMIFLKEHHPIVKVLNLHNGQDNFIVSKAWNTGTQGLNTLTIEIYDGNLSNTDKFWESTSPTFTQELESEPGVSGSFILKCH